MQDIIETEMDDDAILAMQVPPRAALLREAEAITLGARNVDYGDPVVNHAHIAAIFNAWVGAPSGIELTARNIAQILQCVKMARRANSPLHRDSYLDDMAYVGIEYECALNAEMKASQKAGQP